jgi:hypothetical protein
MFCGKAGKEVKRRGRSEDEGRGEAQKYQKSVEEVIKGEEDSAGMTKEKMGRRILARLS